MAWSSQLPQGVHFNTLLGATFLQLHTSGPTPTNPPRPPSRRVLCRLLEQASPTLPPELCSTISDYVLGAPASRRAVRQSGRPLPMHLHPAQEPPRNNSEPFMKLPTELRRQIFLENLGSQNKVFHPTCGESDASTKKTKAKTTLEADWTKKRAHTFPNLVTINRKIRGELTELLYREQTFVIHVHEGLLDGGVEILNAGRQPLQYLDDKQDKRFSRFEDGQDFGFSSMKKVIIEIHPTTEAHDRHVALNTHFMILALARLLQRSECRITSIKIQFATRQTSATDQASRAAILRHEKPWMDSNGAKASSFYNVSDIELMLRPFARLTYCHSAAIMLPSYLAEDASLSAFARDLGKSMESRYGTLLPNETLERHVESVRPELEDFVLALRYGNGKVQQVSKLTDKDWDDEDSAIESTDEDEKVGISTKSSKKKRRRNTATSALKRKKTDDSVDESYGSFEGLLSSVLDSGMDEEEQLLRAMEESTQPAAKPKRKSARKKAQKNKKTKQDVEVVSLVTDDEDEVDDGKASQAHSTTDTGLVSNA